MSSSINPYMVLKMMTTLAGIDIALDNPALLPFCTAAAEELDGRLKDKKDCNHHLVLNAAACTAYYLVCLSDFLSAGGISTFKAGDISMGSNSEEIIQTAAALRDHAMSAASMFFTDKGFYFKAT